MATASGDADGARRAFMPYVAYAVVLALLGGAGVAFWLGQRGGPPILPTSDRASPPAATAAPAEPSPPAAALKLPPRPEAPAASAPVGQKSSPAPDASAAPVPMPSASPSPASPSQAPSPPNVAGASAPAAAPPKTRCTVDGAWPAERTDQGKAIQGLLRDLGLYDGTVYGTVGPMTRAAIRKFQVSAGQPETGEPDQALFDSLKKVCAAPSP